MGSTNVSNLQVPVHNSILYLLLKVFVQEKTQPCFTCGVVDFHLAFGD
jgi:hypothetical protein